jgi:PHS family inorganic phosphate transporter-like MFS transporter
VIAQFFFNFGPNATTFIVPGECFPTRYRSTSHGFSAAAGKVGAIIAQCVFGPLVHRGAKKDSSDSPWLNHVMQIFALFMFCGIFTSFLIPETKRKTLEELSGEIRPLSRPQLAGVQDGARNEDAEKGNVNVNAPNLNTLDGDGNRNENWNELV